MPTNVGREEPSQWERNKKPSASASASSKHIRTVVPASRENGNGWTRKSPLENLLPQKESSSPAKPTVNIHAVMQLQQMRHIVLSCEDRHGADKPCWHLEALREPRQMNTQHKAIGHGSFFKHCPYNYTNDEFNIPQRQSHPHS